MNVKCHYRVYTSPFPRSRPAVSARSVLVLSSCLTRVIQEET